MNREEILMLMLVTAIWSHLTPQRWFVDVIVFLVFAGIAAALDQ